jgi:predicted ATPase
MRLLFVIQIRMIGNIYFFNPLKDKFYLRKGQIRYEEALNIWLELMGINGFKPEPKNEIVYLNLKSKSSKNTSVNIADVGFGVSQILPILVEGLRMPRNGTLLLEQPEIHLHPNLQMQMADYFISLALSKKRLIIETHSDHIINRLVRRIVEDTKLNLKDLIGIYFVTASDKGSIIEEVQIDPNSGIVNWPNDFFDQTASEQQKIIEAGLKKRLVNNNYGENAQ